MRARRLTVFSALTALVLVLAGCTGGGGEGLGSEGSPLDEYWNAVVGTAASAEEAQRGYDEEKAQIEALIAACMAKEGFEYLPDTRATVVFGSAGAEGMIWEPESAEWVAQWGYGTVYSPYDVIPAVEAPAETVEDPNEEYFAALSAAEQAAYQKTLSGSPPSGEEPADGDEQTWADGGCYGAASHEIRGESVQDSGAFDDLMKRMDEVSGEVSSSPQMLALDREWAACMAEGGYPGFTTQYDATESVDTELSELYRAGFEANPDVEIDKSAPAMKELGAKEVALALVDLDCREKTDYRDEALRIRFAVEEQFVQQNKAELERYKAAMEQSR